jgi:hypothetical protein
MPPPRKRSFPDGSALLGDGVFWIRAGYQDLGVLHLGQTTYTEWAQWKWVVEVGPDYAQPITLDLWNLDSGAIAWWSATLPQPSTQSLILDPTLDTEDVGAVTWLAAVPHGESAPGWKEWGIFPLFAVAGCHSLEASWAGGSWRSVLAVGN